MNFLRTILPRDKLGDFLYSLFRFMRVHKRLPKKKSFRFNDPYFFMKVGADLDKPIRAFTTDKEFLKLFVKAVVGDQYNVKTLGVIRSIDELKGFPFPDRCCIKASHGSGWYYIRSEGEKLPIEEFKYWLNSNYYNLNRERNYKYLEPKIIVEPLVFDSTRVWDYKAFCCRGKFKLMNVIVDRNENQKRIFFDRKWRALDIKMSGMTTDLLIKKPACFSDMIMLAEKIACFFELVRVDFYTDGKKILIGEFTHCVGSASSPFETLGHEELMGQIIFRT